MLRYITSESDESDNENILLLFFAVLTLKDSSELVGGVGSVRGSRGLLPVREGPAADRDVGGLAAGLRGTFMLPFGGLADFMNAPTSFLPVAVGL